ncbi:Protein BZZ1, variant 2 [Stygiomarasmius scandens]
MESLFVLGNDPTKAWSESTLKQSTLNGAYDGIINSMVSSAQDHLNIAEVLTTQVVDVLKALEKKNEEVQKKEIQFFQKLIADRDRTYNDRLKTKQKYDEECEEVEANRQKQGRAHDDRHADRVARQAEQQRNDMLNSKNMYLISTAIANKTKAKFYNADLVHLEDQLRAYLGHVLCLIFMAAFSRIPPGQARGTVLKNSSSCAGLAAESPGCVEGSGHRCGDHPRKR